MDRVRCKRTTSWVSVLFTMITLLALFGREGAALAAEEPSPSATVDVTPKTPAVDEIPGEDLSLQDLFNLKVRTASQTKESLITTPGTVYVITEEEIKRYGWMSLREALASIPNLELMWQWNWLAGGQRGFAAPGNFSNTLLMLDGREVQNLLADEAFITSVFSTHKVLRIEVLQGPISTLYGAAAMQGVINIVTKYGAEGKDVTSIQAIRGAVGTEQLSAVFRKSGADYTLGMSTSFYHSDQNYDSLAQFAANSDLYSNHPQVPATGGGTVDIDGFRYLGTDDFHIPETSYSLDLYARYKDFYAGIDYFRTINTEGIEYVKADYSGNEARRGAELYYAGVEHSFSDKLKAKVELQYYNESDEWLTRGPQTIPTPPPANYGEFVGEVDGDRNSDPNYAVRIRSLADYDTGSVGHWVGGFDFTQVYIKEYAQLNSVWPVPESEVQGRPFSINRDYATFVQDAFKLLPSVTVTAGARYLLSNYVQNQLLPRVSLVYQPVETGAIKLTFGEGYRGPNYFEQAFAIANNIPPVKMKMVELNYTQQANIHPLSLMNIAAVYWMQTPVQYISVQNADGINYTTDIVDSPFNVRGFEDQLKFEIGAFNGMVGFRYALPDQSTLAMNPTVPLTANVPLTKIKIGAGYRFTHNLDASVFIDHWAKVDTDGPTPDGTSDQVYTVPAWTVVNGKVSVSDIKLDSMKVRVDGYLENIFDAAYYNANIRGLGAPPLQYLQPPRNFRVQLTVDI